MYLLVVIVVGRLVLGSAQQMCMYQGHWTDDESIVTFDSVSTLHTSTIQESLVDVSKINTTGEIIIKGYGGEYGEQLGGKNTKFHIQLTVAFHDPDLDDRPNLIAQVYLQKNGKITLVDSYSTVTGGGYRENVQTVVGLHNDRDRVPEKKLGYLLLNQQHKIEEFHETGYLRRGDSIRLVTGKIKGAFLHSASLDISVCIIYDDGTAGSSGY